MERPDNFFEPVDRRDSVGIYEGENCSLGLPCTDIARCPNGLTWLNQNPVGVFSRAT